MRLRAHKLPMRQAHPASARSKRCCSAEALPSSAQAPFAHSASACMHTRHPTWLPKQHPWYLSTAPAFWQTSLWPRPSHGAMLGSAAEPVRTQNHASAAAKPEVIGKALHEMLASGMAPSSGGWLIYDARHLFCPTFKYRGPCGRKFNRAIQRSTCRKLLPR
jgi:hypothetical protein